MSKERAQRRAEREREAAVVAAARAAEAERKERRAARLRAVDLAAAEAATRPDRRDRRAPPHADQAADRRAWWSSTCSSGSPPATGRSASVALLISLLIAPVVHILMTKN